MAGWGLGRPTPSRFPYPGSPQTSGVAPPGNTQVFRGRLVIIFGPTGTVSGIFMYAPGTTPGPGNPPIAWLTNTSTDPYGNAVSPQFGVRDSAGQGVSLTNNQLIFLGSFGFTGAAQSDAYLYAPPATSVSGQSTLFVLSPGDQVLQAMIQMAGQSNDSSQPPFIAFNTWDNQTSAVLAGGLQLRNGLSAVVPPSGDTSGATDVAVINARLAAGYAVQLLPGAYYINAALTPGAYGALNGPNRELCTIHQVSTTANGIELGSSSGFRGGGFTMLGPGSGTGQGIHGSASPLEYVYLDGCKFRAFGSNGVNLGGPIITHLRQVVAEINGGAGISLFSSPTSTVLDACYANANTGNGFSLAGLHYGVLNGCVADTNGGVGISMSSCIGCTINGGGIESSTGNQMTMSNGRCNTVNGLFFFATASISVNCTSEIQATLTGLHEQTPGGGATAFIQTDANSRIVVENDDHVTANSFAPGTCYEILFNGGVVH